MARIISLFIILGLSILAGMMFSDSYAVFNLQHNQSKASITVSYTNDTSIGYKILVDSNQKYTISHGYAWTNNNVSRFSLQSYSIDNGPFVDIKRKSSGNFTLDLVTDLNHSIVFLAKPQFKIILSEENKAYFSPPSPTNDNWFDANSNVKIIVPRVLLSNQENMRQQLSGWSLDSSDINIISREELGSFKSPVIPMSSTHKIHLEYITQYYISAISNFGRTLGTGWYDSGTIVNVSLIPGDDIFVRHVFIGWEGSVIGNGKQESVSVLVDSPKIIAASWDMDYTNASIIVIVSIAVLVSMMIYQKRKIRPKTAQV